MQQLYGKTLDPKFSNADIFVRLILDRTTILVNEKPTIIRTNTNGVTPLAISLNNPNGPNKTNVDDIPLEDSLAQQSNPQCKLQFLLPSPKRHCRNSYTVSVPTHQYLYNGNFSNIYPRSWEDAYHSSILPLMFGTSSNAHGSNTDLEMALSDLMQDLYSTSTNDPWRGLPTHS